MLTWTFRVVAPTVPGEVVAVVGSCPPLGAWDINRAVTLAPAAAVAAGEPSPDAEGAVGVHWQGTVDLPLGAPSQFKFVVLRESDKRILRWEAFPGNRVVTPGALDLVGADHVRQSSTHTHGSGCATLAAINAPGCLLGRSSLSNTHVELGPWWEVDVAAAAMPHALAGATLPITVAVWQAPAHTSEVTVSASTAAGPVAATEQTGGGAGSGVRVFTLPSTRLGDLGSVRVSGVGLAQLRLARVQVLVPVAAREDIGSASALLTFGVLHPGAAPVVSSGWLPPHGPGIVRFVLGAYDAVPAIAMPAIAASGTIGSPTVAAALQVLPAPIPYQLPAHFANTCNDPEAILARQPTVQCNDDGTTIIRVDADVFASPSAQFAITVADSVSGAVIGVVTIPPSTLLSTMGVVRAPLVSPGTLTTVGVVTTTYSVILPFVHDNNNLSTLFRNHWKERPALLTGHRGVGKSFKQPPGVRKAVLKENTLVSFATAAQMGADMVEFDAMLTSDGVPVIYHDFSLEVFLSEEPAATPWAPVLSEDPIEMGIHELSLRSIGRIKTHHLREGNKQSLLAQLTRKHWAAITAMAQALSTGAGGSTPPSPNSTPPRTSGAGAADAADASSTPGTVAATADSMAGAIAPAVADAASGPALAPSGASAVVAGTTPCAPPRPPRSASEDAGDKSSMPSSVGGVGTGAGAGTSGTRSRGHSFTSTARSESTSGVTSRVQATLYKMPTLQSLFQSLPTHLAFDVEVKYPVETAHRHFTEHVKYEINRFCDAILKVVFEHVGGRRVIFTCFHPEVCVALHLKQAAFPVLLLTEGSPPPANYDDVRCKSLPAALASAINEGLQGIAPSAASLLAEPHVGIAAQARGMLVFTWGAANNSHDNVATQKAMRVNAIIADNIGDHTKGNPSQFAEQ